MALGFSQDTQFGITATYHRIEAYTWSKANKIVVVCINSYIDEKNKNKACLAQNSYTIMLGDSFPVNGPEVAKLYEVIKEQYLPDAEDC